MAKQTSKAAAEQKLPPQSIEAEMCVLGAMLLEESAIGTAIEHLEPSSFYRDAHQKIFHAMLELYQESRAVDAITLVDVLRKKGWLESVGGAAAVAALSGAVPTAANVLHYAKIVKEKALLRALIRAATDIVTRGYEETDRADLLLDKAQAQIFEIATKRIEGQVYVLKDVIKDTIETIDRLYQKKGYITGLATGFEELDRMTAGLQASDLVIVAGRPSMGKSALAGCIAEHVGVVQKIPTAIFSLEMSKEHLVQRMLCSHARVNGQNMRSGYLAQSDWPKLTLAAGKLSEAPIYIDDTPGISVLELRAKARRLKSQHQIGLVILDYLQLMQGPPGAENRQQEVSEVSRNLKALARELEVPVVAVSQLSRAPERRDDNRPKLSDLRESGALEQDSDVVLLLFREEYYNAEDEGTRGVADLIIAKQRNGPVGSVKLAFLKEYTRFENLTLRPDAQSFQEVEQ